MQFNELKKQFQKHVYNIFKDNDKLFIVDLDKDLLWDTYLNSFPKGTNPIYRERREHDCSCCRHFIKSFGNVAAIKNNKIISIWDFDIEDGKYGSVVTALSNIVKSATIRDVFITKESKLGTDYNYEKNEIGDVKKWEHFHVVLPKKFVSKSSKSEASLMGEIRDIRNVFKRSLDEISKDSIETVLDLIAQKSLYKGDEWSNILVQFMELKNEYLELDESDKNNYCWKKSLEVGGVVGKIRNHSIGVLLIDISNGMDLNDAVKRYESIVAPTNYKRPKAIFTKKMIEQAQQAIVDMGLIDSLERRHATLDDITVNNILFSNKDSAKRIAGDVFQELNNDIVANPKQFDKVEEVSIDRFVEKILPTTTNMEILFENKHISNLVSLIAPKVKDSKNFFKWGNNFSWAYNGNITDSMKERVKTAGGNVEGILRFSIQWNENGDNENDFDAHCVEPNKNRIFFQNKRMRHPSTGMLDVDIIHPKPEQIAVENITWTDLDRMQEGRYVFYVHNYSHRGGRSGFSAEIEYDGQIYSYDYNKELRKNEHIMVAEIQFKRRDGIKFINSLPSSTSSRMIWSINTNQFYPVSVFMFSPNYWDGQNGIGHKHYMFMLNSCKNDTMPNGFFNEFLREDFMKHKRVFEALGSKMKVEKSDDQLSGLGFSSTKRNTLTCKVEGHFNRMIKLLF